MVILPLITKYFHALMVLTNGGKNVKMCKARNKMDAKVNGFTDFALMIYNINNSLLVVCSL